MASISDQISSSATETAFKKVTKLPTENAAFVPRGLKAGLPIRNGKQIFLLNKDIPTTKDDYAYDFEAITAGNLTVFENIFLPGRYEAEMLVLNVQYPPRKTLVAIASHERTIIKCRFDFI